MTRLSRYLSKLFAIEALSFFFVAAFLVWITQALRLFDLVTAKGQDMLTLLGQSLLTTPPLALAIIYICMGIGMARALRSLQDSRELHSIHSSGRTRALWGAVSIFVLGGVIAVSLFAHVIEPWSKRAYSQWSEEVAADLVGRALNPHRFSEVVPGLFIVIGGRDADGTIRDFFADDKRAPDTERTYIADRAVIVFDDQGYNLSLEDGAVQYIRKGEQFTEVEFNRYELSLDRLTDDGGIASGLEQKGSLTIIAEGISNGGLTALAWRKLNERLAEATRVIALCLVVAALAAFPHARRGRDRLPIEVTVLVLGLADRTLSSITVAWPVIGPHFGAICLMAIAILFFVRENFSFRLRLPQWRAA